MPPEPAGRLEEGLLALLLGQAAEKRDQDAIRRQAQLGAGKVAVLLAGHEGLGEDSVVDHPAAGLVEDAQAQAKRAIGIPHADDLLGSRGNHALEHAREPLQQGRAPRVEGPAVDGVDARAQGEKGGRSRGEARAGAMEVHLVDAFAQDDGREAGDRRGVQLPHHRHPVRSHAEAREIPQQGAVVGTCDMQIEAIRVESAHQAQEVRRASSYRSARQYLKDADLSFPFGSQVCFPGLAELAQASLPFASR
ncbi:hypothetical protein D3C87_699960 [compost metagenome]